MCVSILPFRIVYFLVSRGLLLDVPGASLCWPGSSLGSFYCAIILGVPIAAFSSIGDIWFPFACVLVCLMWTDSERSCPVCYYCLAQCPLCPVFLLCFRTVVGFSRWYGLPSFFPLRIGILWEVCWGCLSSLGGQVRVSVCAVLCSVLFTIL